MDIITDHKWKSFKYRDEVPNTALEEFDYLDEDVMNGFLHYRGIWFHISDFMLVGDDEKLKDWDGIMHLSAFDGVVIKISKDMERYKIGRIH